MKCSYTSIDSRLQVDWDSGNVKEMFEQLAALQEVFEEPHCGCCQSTRIRADVRTPQTFKYFQLVCQQCGARLDFGQSKDLVRLFAKRTDKDGNPIPNHGWYIYTGPDSDPHDRTTTYPPAAAPSTVSGNTRPASGGPDAATVSRTTRSAVEQRLASAMTAGIVDQVVGELNAGLGKRLLQDDATAVRWAVQAAKKRIVDAAAPPGVGDAFEGSDNIPF